MLDMSEIEEEDDLDEKVETWFQLIIKICILLYNTQLHLK